MKKNLLPLAFAFLLGYFVSDINNETLVSQAKADVPHEFYSDSNQRLVEFILRYSGSAITMNWHDSDSHLADALNRGFYDDRIRELALEAYERQRQLGNVRREVIDIVQEAVSSGELTFK